VKDQIKATISKKLLVKLGSRMRTDVDYGWMQVKAAVQGAADEDKAQIIQLLLGTDLLRAHLNTLADAEADAMLANDSLDLTELDKIL
jgi:Holliday junction resolvasome RuvABC endonuclease subunit